MYKYEAILFDLDGTLTDPGEGITNSVAYALRKFGIIVADTSALRTFIGPPLHESFQREFGFDEKKSFLAVDFYREYYQAKGIFENRLYDQTIPLLEALRDAGRQVILSTSKPERYAVEILKHFQFEKYFSHVCGACMDGTRTAKADVIRYSMETALITDPSRAVMVGDREHDIIGAHANHMDAIGVLYGYGNRDELESANADFIAENMYEILSIVC